jgi:RHS repeat-associated protein
VPTVFFTGKPYDADLGAYLFNYRSYDPALCRWTTPDPSGFPDGANNWVYAPVPTMEIDPLGLAIGANTYASLAAAVYALPLKQLYQVDNYGSKKLMLIGIPGELLGSDSDVNEELSPLIGELKNNLKTWRTDSIYQTFGQREFRLNSAIWQAVLATGQLSYYAQGSTSKKMA